MITAWDVYWVMQLDSIRGSLWFLGYAGIATVVGLTLWNGISRFDTAEFPSLCNAEERKAAWKVRGDIRQKALLACIPAVLLASFLPSSKTAAAMIILPALTSEEVTKPLAKEAGDLYRLAKRALEEAVDAEPEPKPAN